MFVPGIAAAVVVLPGFAIAVHVGHMAIGCCCLVVGRIGKLVGFCCCCQIARIVVDGRFDHSFAGAALGHIVVAGHTAAVVPIDRFASLLAHFDSILVVAIAAVVVVVHTGFVDH